MKAAFRHRFLGLMMLVGLAASLTAIADASISSAGGRSSGSLEERMTQLERIVSGQGDLITQLQQQVSDQQRDIENLRGQVQQNQYQLEQTRKQNEQTPPGSGTSDTGGGSTGSIQIEGADAGSKAVTSSDNTGNAAIPASSGDANKDYNIAVSLALEKKQFDNAIVAFQQFVKQYPDSTFQPNANYWLGQLYFNKGEKDQASYYFANVVKNYPKSPKSPDAMLKVGVIMQEKGEADKAKAVYSQLIKVYPESNAAKQAQQLVDKK